MQYLTSPEGGAGGREGGVASHTHSSFPTRKVDFIINPTFFTFFTFFFGEGEKLSSSFFFYFFSSRIHTHIHTYVGCRKRELERDW